MTQSQGTLIWLTSVVLSACTPEAPPPPSADPTAPIAPAASASVDATAGLGPRFDLRFDDRATHMVDVEAAFPTGGEPTLAIWMPVWTPGSYLVREYARHVEGVSAADSAGATLPVTRTAKNRWTVETGGESTVIVRYRLYAREAAVQTNFVDGDLAVLNGAATFMTPEGAEQAPHRVVAHLPSSWSGGYTGLDPTTSGATSDWTAATYDELVDSPIVLGSPTLRHLDVGDVSHRFVLAGDLGPWDVDRSTADVETLVATQLAFWGDIPYRNYTFLNVVNERRGGLEHLDSTLMMTNRFATSSREAYVSWLGLVSHEFFHTWNVKRLKPKGLGPFNYEEEVYTPSLWVAEGLTSYYDDLLLVRAGLMNEAEYLERLSKPIGRLHNTPGRQVQTLEQASRDAWIKHYRKDENTVNTAISYYSKGLLVGWIIDAEIRRATHGNRTLDDVMRLAYERHGQGEGYTPEEFEAVIHEVAGRPLNDLLDQSLRTTDELDFAPAVAWFGLRFADPDAAKAEAKEKNPGAPVDPDPAWLGADTESRHGRVVLTHVRRGTPAHAAGLQVDDELLAIDGWRVPAEGPDALLASIRPGTDVSTTVSRRGALRTITVRLGDAPKPAWTLEIDPDAPATAAGRRRAWLGLGSGG